VIFASGLGGEGVSRLSPTRFAAWGFLLLGRLMALASLAYRDPMEVYAAKQAREQRRNRAALPRTSAKVANSPLPEFPRRWADDERPAAWSEARRAAEALFTDEPTDKAMPSVARLVAESLFS
jgi:hypothetical protein